MGQIFGPVPSRRLGFSLGVDTIPFKTCSLNCIYCQLGRTINKTIQRKEYIAADDILREIEEVLREGKRIDYITFSGSGEPTLNSEIRRMISRIKELTSIPLAILTNGTLLYRPRIREDLMEADLVIPSLDTVTQEIFEMVNRPHPSLKIEKVITGIDSFSQEFNGKVWLEIMVVKGINDSLEEIEKAAQVIKQMNLEKIQLNTVVRPPTEEFARPLTREDLKNIKTVLGKKCEIIAEFKRATQKAYKRDVEKRILSMVKRRPVTLVDISHSLGLHRNEIIKYVETLEKKHQVKTEVHSGERYYR
ncbi:radical SAM protein [Candidatus Aerophobetes bacterium]|uniref:Radical SAM protein n=2 Tax=root TaxID=1 RepID=A0A523YRS6_UNCAE|nr:MAG: radical SAM protein [Candidatus Aerophobetes bacterium]